MFSVFDNPGKEPRIITEEEFDHPSEEKIKAIQDDFKPGPKEQQIMDKDVRLGKLKKSFEDNFLTIEHDRLNALTPEEIEECERLLGGLPKLMNAAMTGKTINMTEYDKAYNRLNEIIRGDKR